MRSCRRGRDRARGSAAAASPHQQEAPGDLDVHGGHAARFLTFHCVSSGVSARVTPAAEADSSQRSAQGHAVRDGGDTSVRLAYAYAQYDYPQCRNFGFAACASGTRPVGPNSVTGWPRPPGHPDSRSPRDASHVFLRRAPGRAVCQRRGLPCGEPRLALSVMSTILPSFLTNPEVAAARSGDDFAMQQQHRRRLLTISMAVD